MNSARSSYTKIKSLVLIAFFSAILTAGKLVLAGLSNIEVITLLIMLYAVTFGIKISLSASLIFCTIETMIFGIYTWTISYFIYWPTLALLSYAFVKIKLNKNLYLIILGTLYTMLFGVITSAVDAIIASSSTQISFFILFSAIYVRGISFYITHVVSNLIILSIILPILRPLFEKARASYFDNQSL